MTEKRSDLDFVSDVLINALNERREDIIPDIYKMYEQIRNRPTIPGGDINIDKVTKPDGTEYNFSLTSEYLPNAADMVSFGGSDDVISFGDYKSQEYRPE